MHLPDRIQSSTPKEKEKKKFRLFGSSSKPERPSGRLLVVRAAVASR